MSVLTRDALAALLGPVTAPGPPAAEVHDEVTCAGYVRRRVSYAVASGRASAFVCVPADLTGPAPVVYCHHQHNGEFALGKSEVCGLRGHPDQAYAAELTQRGCITIAPDAIGFEDRNWSGDQNITWFELSNRLVHGRTLLADCLQEISLALDYAASLPEADPGRIGFIGHSYGGRTAMWAPAWDPRIRASVSNCGCIPYRDSYSHDTGLQAEFVIPGFAASYDVEDVLALASQCGFLLIAADDDRWSRGARDIEANLRARRADHVRVHRVPGGHDFRRPERELAYDFLEAALAR
ncbi:dienelactone hydrolase family protein [Dactylosporangium sp. NPDC051541]|uniref:dienelactone hydrolase family protein n=1 Tax=Dactylosporangium sp. NPDC051541 TaxID=3363977 RepID=UPI0037A6DBB6